MFEKLLALIPYNPGLIHQMSFYGRRMREESAIRRIGMIFIVLAFLVQFVAVLSPPQQAAAATSSDNDLIRGGITPVAGSGDTGAQIAKRKCLAGTPGEEFGSIIHHFGMTCEQVGAAGETDITVSGYSNNYYSMGRTPLGKTDPATHKATDEKSYPGVPKNGTIYSRHLSSFYSNSQTQVHVLKVLDSKGNFLAYIMFGCGNVVTIGHPVEQDVLEAPDLPPPTGGATTTTTTTTDTPIVRTCPAGQVLFPDQQCYVPCQFNPAIPYGTSQCPQPCPQNNAIPIDSPQCFEPCPQNHAIPIDSPQCFEPCPYNNAIPIGNSACKPCDKSTSQQDAIACVVIHKKASNLTANVTDANNTTAQPNDQIIYTLSATNNGKADVDKFTFQESLGDVLDYADVVDLHGGTIDKNNLITWPSQKIEAGTTATHQVTIKVKDPIPSTPAGSSNPAQFDLIMTNVYGDTINIKVPAPPVKAIQTVAAKLPNTGPGSTMVIIALIMILGSYFYSRSRLLAHESILAIQENTQA